MASDMTPEELLRLHKDYADEFSQLAQSGIQQAFGALSSSGLFHYVPAHISIAMPNFGTPKRNIPLPEQPATPTLPAIGEMKDYVGIPNPDTSVTTPPDNNLGRPPTFTMPPKPGAVPDLTATPPTIDTNIDLPDLPDYLQLPNSSLPYKSINLPGAPNLTEPTFEGSRPSPITLPDPATVQSMYATEQRTHRADLPTFAQAQADALLAKYCPEYAQLRARINTAIITYTDPVTGGGTGVPTNIENAIAARNSDRNAVEFQRALDTAGDTLGKLGYSMPPGALAATLRASRMAMGDAQVRGNVEIATKNFELEQTNFQFLLKLGQELELKVLETLANWLQLALKMDELALMSAKELLAAYIGAYNLQVMVYRALYEGYQADADVYKSKWIGLQERVKVYEAQIRAELAKTEINKSTVEVLQAVAAVNRALADTYKAELDAALAPLEIARLQLAIYESQVRAYVAETQGYELQWQGFKAEVDGEIGKMRGYESQAAGYTAQVQGYRSRVEAYAEQVKALAVTNQAVTGRNEGTVRTYTAQAEAAIKNYEGLVAGYTAVSNSVIKQADIEVEYWRTTANLVMQEFNVAVNQTFEYAREQMNLFRAQMEAAVSAGNGLAHAAQVAGTMAGAAMTGLTSFAGRFVSSEE